MFLCMSDLLPACHEVPGTASLAVAGICCFTAIPSKANQAMDDEINQDEEIEKEGQGQ